MENGLLKTINQLPEKDGIYLFKNAKGSIIYIGKSKNIRKRVMSYFTPSAKVGRKRKMISLIRGIDFIRVSTELEALLLEDEMIKKHLPEYNKKQKDFTNYRYYSLIDAEFPALVNGHRPRSNSFYGPFPKAGMARRVFEFLTDNLKLRTCNTQKAKNHCIRHELGFCLGPCFGAVDENQYSKNLGIAIAYLEGENSQFIDIIEEQMNQYAMDLKFEKAQEIKEALKMLRGYFLRQDFFSHYSNGGVYVECRHNHSQSFLFYRGLLLGVSKDIFSRAKLESIMRNRLDNYKYIDKFSKVEKYDRANIVFTWMMKKKDKRSYIYL